MGLFFAGNYSGQPFILFGAAHFAALGLLIALNVFLLRFKTASGNTKYTLRQTLALILWGNEISWHMWNYALRVHVFSGN